MKKKINNNIFISGTSNKLLASKIAESFDSKLGQSEIINFADGEISFVLKENVADKNVFAVQSLSFNPNTHLFELLVICDTLLSKLPKSLNVLIPYLGYSRSDREVIEGESVTASLVPKLLSSVGIRKVFSLDVHSQRVIDHFENSGVELISIDSLPVFTNYFKGSHIRDAVIVSPDKGGLARSRKASDQLGIPYFQFDKKRPSRNKVEFKKSDLDLKGKDVFIFEDIIDTAGTIVGVSEMLKSMGCKKIYIFATHGLFSGMAISKINASSITKVVVTDTVDNGENVVLSPKLEILSVSDVFTSYLN